MIRISSVFIRDIVYRRISPFKKLSCRWSEAYIIYVYDLLSFFDFFLAFAFYDSIVCVRVFSDRFSTHKKSKKSYMVMIGIQTGEEAAR